MKELVYSSIPIVMQDMTDKIHSGLIDELNLSVVREGVIAHLLKEGIDVCDGGKIWNEFDAIWSDPHVEKLVCDWLDDEYERL